METQETGLLGLLFPATYEEDRIVKDHRRGVFVHVGGVVKLRHMRGGQSPAIPFDNLTVAALLRNLASLCMEYYSLFDHRSMQRRYAPQRAGYEDRERNHAEPEDDENIPILSHEDIISILRKYGESEDHELVTWERSRDLVKGTDDFFREANLIPSKDNAFSGSLGSHYTQPSQKKRKLNDGSVGLASIQENAAEHTGGPSSTS